MICISYQLSVIAPFISTRTAILCGTQSVVKPPCARRWAGGCARWEWNDCKVSGFAQQFANGGVSQLMDRNEFCYGEGISTPKASHQAAVSRARSSLPLTGLLLLLYWMDSRTRVPLWNRLISFSHKDCRVLPGARY